MADMPRRFPATLLDCFTDFPSPLLNEMIQLEMEFAGGIDAGRLAKAVDLTFDAEPILGSRFVDSCRRPYFERLDRDKRSAFLLASQESEYETFKSSPIDHRNGPQIRVCLWPSLDGDRLLIKVAHQVADAGGTKDVAAVLSSIYSRLSDDPAYRPSPNIRGSRSSRQVLRHVPWHAYPRIYMNGVQELMRLSRVRDVQALYVLEGPREPLGYVGRLIPSVRATSLAEYGRSHSASLNDIFTAASLRALVSLGNWQGRSHVSLQTTLDMRRYIPSGRAEAVANLSAGLYRWPDLGTEPGRDFETTLDRVARITRYGKTHWIGFEIPLAPYAPLVKIMPHAWGVKRLERAAGGGGGHGFTNTGPIDPGSVTFGTQPSMAHIMPPQVYPPTSFIYSLSGYNGTLTLLAGAYPTQKETIERFFDAVLKELPV
jgi:NRPS condensation-like uncharacterized protein